MEDNNVGFAEETTPQKAPKNVQEKLISIFNSNRNLIIILITILVLVLATSILFLSSKHKNQTKIDNTTSPTASPSLSPSPTESATPAHSAYPTVKPTATAAPTTRPTSTPVPTQTTTPTSTPQGKPTMNITYPTEGQSISMNSSQTFCVVDTPGSNTQGLLKKQNTGSGWTDYKDMYTTCYDPSEGANTLQLQYKNGSNQESDVYTIHFNFHHE